MIFSTFLQGIVREISNNYFKHACYYDNDIDSNTFDNGDDCHGIDNGGDKNKDHVTFI